MAPLGSGTPVQDHVALAEIELCGELMIAASAADGERLSPDRIDEVLKVGAGAPAAGGSVAGGSATGGSATGGSTAGSPAAGAAGADEWPRQLRD
ncbi:hypothetical protein [Streptomyces flavidovirens]|uniref:hypothetical protein n=1 Tax=Streptomyces flavidovirens TaxID=67298 RepID=UPI0003F61BD0|nr:hypothetical protein [Streptomyces flavidovirens]